jgi:hypothetical protein
MQECSSTSRVVCRPTYYSPRRTRTAVGEYRQFSLQVTLLSIRSAGTSLGRGGGLLTSEPQVMKRGEFPHGIINLPCMAKLIKTDSSTRTNYIFLCPTFRSLVLSYIRNEKINHLTLLSIYCLRSLIIGNGDQLKFEICIYFFICYFFNF